MSPDTRFDWNSCCGVRGVHNFCSRSLSFGYHYDNWLYLVILSLLISDSTGIFDVAYMPLKISGLATSRLHFVFTPKYIVNCQFTFHDAGCEWFVIVAQLASRISGLGASHLRLCMYPNNM